MRAETMELMMEGVKEAFNTYSEEVVEKAITNWFSDIRYCSDPDTPLEPLSFSEHLELAEKKIKEEKDRDEKNRKWNESYKSLTDAERAYGVTIDNFGNKTKPLSLGS